MLKMYNKSWGDFMDIRLLTYYLKVAQVGNITRAAQQLHITQPTLSRQLTKLEEEVGVQLLTRSQHHLALTEAGVTFERRAKQILSLLATTKKELQTQQNDLAGLLKIGCVESKLSLEVANWLQAFQAKHPQVQFEFYDADGDDLKEKLDTHYLDFAFLIEPVETAKYNFLTLPYYDQWGIIVNKSHPLAKQKNVSLGDLKDEKLILSRRNIVKAEIDSWLAPLQALSPKFFINLPSNANFLVLNHNYCALGIEGILTLNAHPDLRFIPFAPSHHSGHVLAWRKNNHLGSLEQHFLAYIQALIKWKNY